MSASDPLTQPNQPTTPPTRTCCQVTTDHINQQSESPSQETTLSSRMSLQPAITKSDKTPTEPIENHRAVPELSVARARKCWTSNDLTQVCTRNVVQLPGNTPQRPPVISDCDMHCAAVLVVCCSAVCVTIADDRWSLRSVAWKLNNIPCTHLC